jgi:hypothetical protein
LLDQPQLRQRRVGLEQLARVRQSPHRGRLRPRVLQLSGATRLSGHQLHCGRADLGGDDNVLEVGIEYVDTGPNAGIPSRVADGRRIDTTAAAHDVLGGQSCRDVAQRDLGRS